MGRATGVWIWSASAPGQRARSADRSAASPCAGGRRARMGKRPAHSLQPRRLPQGALKLRRHRQGQASVIRRWLLALAFAVSLLAATPALADDFRPAYLQISQSGDTSYDVLWKIPALGEDTVLKVRPTFPPGTTNLTPQRNSYAN